MSQHTLDLGLHIVDGVRGLHLKGDGFAREGLDENLHFAYSDSEILSETTDWERSQRLFCDGLFGVETYLLRLLYRKERESAGISNLINQCRVRRAHGILSGRELIRTRSGILPDQGIVVGKIT